MAAAPGKSSPCSSGCKTLMRRFAATCGLRSVLLQSCKLCAITPNVVLQRRRGRADLSPAQGMRKA